MRDDSNASIEELLSSPKADEVRRGLALAKAEISKVVPHEARPLYEMIAALFYIDPLDRPDLMPLLNEAVGLISGFGEWVIPVLIENLEAGDVKAQMAVAHALGRMGGEAVEPLVSEYRSTSDAALRTFILYALAKIKSPKVIEAVPLALKASESSDRELRDTATRALGKFAETIPPSEIPGELRADIVVKLQANLGDENPGIRSKAVRSLGKLAKHGYLTAGEKRELEKTLIRTIGEDDRFNWDRAYIVRREAKEALRYLPEENSSEPA